MPLAELRRGRPWQSQFGPRLTTPLSPHFPRRPPIHDTGRRGRSRPPRPSRTPYTPTTASRAFVPAAVRSTTILLSATHGRAHATPTEVHASSAPPLGDANATPLSAAPSRLWLTEDSVVSCVDDRTCAHPDGFVRSSQRLATNTRHSRALKILHPDACQTGVNRCRAARHGSVGGAMHTPPSNVLRLAAQRPTGPEHHALALNCMPQPHGTTPWQHRLLHRPFRPTCDRDDHALVRTHPRRLSTHCNNATLIRGTSSPFTTEAGKGLARAHLC
jgi:hypothetical protein